MLGWLKKKNKDPEKELQRLLKGYELPSFPAAVMNVLGMLRDSESSIVEIAAQIEIDPGMQVKVLKAVNSAAFGLATNVSNIRHAISLLGRSRLESIVLSMAIKGAVPGMPVPTYDMNEFWLSAACRATVSRALAKRLHPATQIESFSAGFLQDMAVPVLMAVKGDEYNEIYMRWINEAGARLDLLEDEAFGYTHTELGTLMARKWELPEYLANAIACHHEQVEGIHVDPAIRLAANIKSHDDPHGIDALATVCEAEHNIDRDSLMTLQEQAYRDAEGFSSMLR